MAAPLTWHYGEDNGPGHYWGEIAPDSLGSHQSPIDIRPAEAEFDRRLSESPLIVSYADDHCRFMTNNGHSVQVDVKDHTDHDCQMSGGPFEDDYLLRQFHFHWGSSSDHGSEHTIDGKPYAAEIHLVHWNRSKYERIEDAMHLDDGLAVLAVFVQSGAEHSGIKSLTDRLHEIEFSDDHIAVHNDFDPTCLLPADITRYWTYKGSLTTPPCHESVRFVIFKEPIEISEQQLEAFRSLRPRPFTRHVAENTEISQHLEDNFRPTMPLNDRHVKSSFRKFFV